MTRGAPTSRSITESPAAASSPECNDPDVQAPLLPDLARIRSAGELVVGLDQNNLPFSTAHPSPQGLDYEIAGLLAQQLGLPLRVYWAYSSHDSYPSKLATKRLCDVILGVMPDDRFGQRVLYSRPYYVARYSGRPVAVRSFPRAEEPLAVEEGVAAPG